MDADVGVDVDAVDYDYCSRRRLAAEEAESRPRTARSNNNRHMQTNRYLIKDNTYVDANKEKNHRIRNTHHSFVGRLLVFAG